MHNLPNENKIEKKTICILRKVSSYKICIIFWQKYANLCPEKESQIINPYMHAHTHEYIHDMPLDVPLLGVTSSRGHPARTFAASKNIIKSCRVIVYCLTKKGKLRKNCVRSLLLAVFTFFDH